MGKITVRDVAEAVIDLRTCVNIKYNGKFRQCEVHSVGVSRTGKDCISAYQTDGERGWKFFLIDKIESISVAKVESLAPRPEYAYNDTRMIEVYKQVETSPHVLP